MSAVKMSAGTSGGMPRCSFATPQLPVALDPSDVLTDPFPHILRRNALPPETYAALEAGFPTLAMILDGRTVVANNQAVRMSVKQVLNDRRLSPLWRGFFEYHTSAAYWREVVRLFGDRFRRAFPGLEEHVGRRYEDWRVTPRGFGGDADIHLDCQFVMNTPVTQVCSVKTAHIDLCDKIFSALYYFRAPTDDAPGGDLEIYRWQRSPRFIKHRVMQRDIVLAKTVEYQANAYVCFLNSENAVHGVSPRGITAIPRRYVNFIAELPIKAFRPRQLNRWQRAWYRHEVRATAHEERY